MSFFSRRLTRASRIFVPSGPVGEKRTAPDTPCRATLASDSDDEGDEESMMFPVELGPTVTKRIYTGPRMECRFCRNDAVWLFTATTDDESLGFWCCRREGCLDDMNELAFDEYFE